MIETRRDLSDYIQADRKAQGMQHPLLAKLTFGENALIRKYMTTSVRDNELYLKAL